MPRKKKDPDFEALIDELTPQQGQFVREYLKDLIGTRAAIRAGYAKDSAHVTASRLIRHKKIRPAIQQGLKELSEATDVSKGWVIQKLKEAHVRAIRGKNDHAAIRALQILAKSLGMLDKDLNLNVQHSGAAQVVLHYPDNGRGPKK